MSLQENSNIKKWSNPVGTIQQGNQTPYKPQANPRYINPVDQASADRWKARQPANSIADDMKAEGVKGNDGTQNYYDPQGKQKPVAFSNVEGKAGYDNYQKFASSNPVGNPQQPAVQQAPVTATSNPLDTIAPNSILNPNDYLDERVRFAASGNTVDPVQPNAVAPLQASPELQRRLPQIFNNTSSARRNPIAPTMNTQVPNTGNPQLDEMFSMLMGNNQRAL
jgi:hypothetical protein